jgi:hypothetical protein
MFFTGVIWNPASPSNDVANFTGSKVLDFGVVPVTTGEYLFCLTIQIGWVGASSSGLARNGQLTFYDDVSLRKTFGWGMSQIVTPVIVDSTPQYSYNVYGTSEGFAQSFKAQVTNGNHLYLKANSECYLLGAQLIGYTLPPDTVTSPGFI